MTRRYIVLIVILGFTIAAAAYWYVTRTPTVVVAAVVRGDAAEVVYANGAVEPRYWAQVTPLVRERIIEHCDCEGEAVVAGAVLARLDAREAEAVLAEAQARLRFAEDELRRLTALSEHQAGNRQELERARTEVAQIEAQIVAQRTRLEHHVIRAPTDGVVLRQDGEVGEIAEPGATLFWIGRPRPLVIMAEVNEEDIPRVATGQRALVRSDAFAGQSLAATVDRVTPMGDAVARTYRVRLTLPDDTPLLVGMSVDVNIVTRVTRDVLLIPPLAVRDASVFVVEEGIARRRAIETGIHGMEAVEVGGGLTQDDRVITPYPDNVADGDAVTVSNAP